MQELRFKNKEIRISNVNCSPQGTGDEMPNRVDVDFDAKIMPDILKSLIDYEDLSHDEVQQGFWIDGQNPRPGTNVVKSGRKWRSCAIKIANQGADVLEIEQGVAFKVKTYKPVNGGIVEIKGQLQWVWEQGQLESVAVLAKQEGITLSVDVLQVDAFEDADEAEGE